MRNKNYSYMSVIALLVACLAVVMAGAALLMLNK